MSENLQAATRKILIEELVKHRKIHMCQAVKIVRCLDTAEDVLQNTALKCLSSKEIRPPLKIRSYVSRMVRNTALDHLRKRRREASESYDEEKISQANHFNQICGYTRLDSKQQLGIALSRISEFPTRKQEIFLKNRVHGVAQNKIAQEFSVSCTLVNFIIKDVDAACRDMRI